MTSRPEYKVATMKLTCNAHEIEMMLSAKIISKHTITKGSAIKWRRIYQSCTSFAGSDPLTTECRFGLLLTHKTTG